VNFDAGEELNDLPHLLQLKTANHAYMDGNGAMLTEKWI